MTTTSRLLATRSLLGTTARRLASDRRGGAMLLTAFAMVPLTFAVGFGVDYSRAMSLQTHLNAAADAAALAAVSPSMILQDEGASAKAAEAIFRAQAALVDGFQGLEPRVTVAPDNSGGNGALGYLRKATVSYTVQSVNAFGGILGARTMTVTGTSSASAAQPPNVDFYLAMDNSPSMLLPATSDGISKILAATAMVESTPDANLGKQCAFACHAMIAKDDGIYVMDPQYRHILLPVSGGDFYRWDKPNNLLYDASGNPMASSTAKQSNTVQTTSNGCNYNTTTTTWSVTTYSVTENRSGPAAVVTKTVTPYTSVKSVPRRRNCGTTSDTGDTKGTQSTSTFNGYWADGYWLTHNYGRLFNNASSIALRKDDMVAAATQLIPFASNQASQYNVTYRAQMFSFDWIKPGNTSSVNQLNDLTNVSQYGSGFSAASLFPADDYWWKNGQPTSSTNNDDRATDVINMLGVMKDKIPTAGTGAPRDTPQKILFIITDGMLDQPNGGGRYFGPMRSNEQTQCTAIKAKGIKIAILYTQYLPESLVGDGWSQSNVAPFLPPPPPSYPRGNPGSSDQVLTALQRCASPGTSGSPLVQVVTADDNIGAALRNLFSTALQTARLVR
ncbi:MAG: pilus assembly protein TadG-related protein [Sphingomonas adhaesiva]|uniref:TadE/TadG family type IV pilus assembly protein n=1 Tax=Sphingomonas adhaesiva TaxID=28212 RepID=UPI002FF87050